MAGRCPVSISAAGGEGGRGERTGQFGAGGDPLGAVGRPGRAGRRPGRAGRRQGLAASAHGAASEGAVRAQRRGQPLGRGADTAPAIGRERILVSRASAPLRSPECLHRPRARDLPARADPLAFLDGSASAQEPAAALARSYDVEAPPQGRGSREQGPAVARAASPAGGVAPSGRRTRRGSPPRAVPAPGQLRPRIGLGPAGESPGTGRLSQARRGDAGPDRRPGIHDARRPPRLRVARKPQAPRPALAG